MQIRLKVLAFILVFQCVSCEIPANSLKLEAEKYLQDNPTSKREIKIEKKSLFSFPNLKKLTLTSKKFD